MEGGAAKSKEAGLAADPKQPKEIAGAGALQGGVADLHPVAQNQARAGGMGAEIGPPKAVVQAPYKEDDHVVAGGDSFKQSELGARGVPLGKKRLDDRQPEIRNDQAAQLAGEERNLDKGKEKIENLIKEQMEKEVQARLEKEQVEREIKEKMARKLELERMEKDRIEQEVQARLEKERLERERQELLVRQKLEKERAEKERVVREVQARVEKERLERERREKLAQEKAEEERIQQVIHKADNEGRKEKNAEEAQERLAQLERAVEDRNAGKAAQEAEREEGKALKKGGRDLKEKVATQEDPREGVEDGAVKAESHPQGSHEKGRDQGEMDLRRRRRALGPGEAEGPPEETRGVPGLEPLLALGGSNLHAALEEQLLAGAMVHSRQIKQASEDERAK